MRYILDLMKKIFNIKKYKNYSLIKIYNSISYPIRIWENKFINKYGKMPLKHQPIFIVGAPRSGSTILYQILTNLYDVLYIDNLVCKLNRNIFFGLFLADKIYGKKPHNNYQSFHGRTKGLHSPAECGQLWYRWFPKDRHYLDVSDVPERTILEIRKEVSSIVNYFDKPIVFKNLNAGQRIRVLSKCFPMAKFLFIIRDPKDISHSILKAKRRIGIPDNQLWSIMPKNSDELKMLEWDEQIVKQIYYLEKQIVEDSSLIDDNNFYIFFYNEFSLRSIKEIAIKLNLMKKSNFTVPEIKIDETIKFSTEAEQINKKVEELDWSFIVNLINNKKIEDIYE